MKKVLLLSVGVFFVWFLMPNSDNVSAKSSTIEVKIDEIWDWPVDGVLTDHYGSRQGTHFGIDIAADEGTDIRVVEDGTIAKSYYSDSYGNVIFVKHSNGMETVYAHMSERFVEDDEKVKKGTVIGLIGNTGKSRGDHLHFEVHKDEWNVHKSNAVDPLAFLDDRHLAINVDAPHLDDSGKLTITITEGDTLWALSQKYDIPVMDLMKWNNLDSDLLVAGQTIVIKKQTSQ
ncbi:peptidoglycan DD-metalloendopeptidase family protein [Bacillus sp. Marseille-Q3570]|uniref:peptidoglycan DD-metalloendopeptidase family protein n=1 Tax=Bacillus sp. Marseille-Q3570 TaxID=2963522 RepID=UPI0021B7C2A3|nr:peptidoglycan DD-metalloendopeptidase family protein [Bacillus sp. Marseille-Q3570]